MLGEERVDFITFLVLASLTFMTVRTCQEEINRRKGLKMEEFEDSVFLIVQLVRNLYAHPYRS